MLGSTANRRETDLTEQGGLELKRTALLLGGD
jgi:hypothetical protein